MGPLPVRPSLAWRRSAASLLLCPALMTLLQLAPLDGAAHAQAGGPPWVSLDDRVWPSPHARVAQTIGVTEISVTYSRPGVKGRTIWGELLPYGRVWRAGADWNTTVTLGDPVVVEGRPLEAGTYSLHLIPNRESFTVIFNRFTGAWGSFSYDEAEDALRLEVKPREANHQEWLSYSFGDLTATSGVLSLRWATLELPIRLEVDTHGIALARFRDGFRSLSGFTWIGKANAARYCYDNDVALEQGLAWIREAREEQHAYDTLALEALLLDKLGRSEEAEPFYAQAVELASPSQLRFLGLRLASAERAPKAARLLARGVERHPSSWRMRVYLARALDAAGETDAARQAYGEALELAPEERHPSLRAALAALRGRSGP
ncbi:MAG: DUF2911 domain-containing protein [Holophagales bacterium]|nr:DUF2911 domain-containing protein [Holophagales bacterium]